MSDLFPLIWDSLKNGFRFFFECFTPLFSLDSSLSFIPFLLFILTCFGALTCILGIIGSGISMVKRGDK